MTPCFAINSDVASRAFLDLESLLTFSCVNFQNFVRTYIGGSRYILKKNTVRNFHMSESLVLVKFDRFIHV